MSDLITVCADQADELAKQDAELATLRARIEALEAALHEFVRTVDILSMRVGMTVKEVADVINPVAKKARAVLGDEQ